MDTAFRAVDQKLSWLINKMWETEGKAALSGEFQDLTDNEIHVIEAIGLSGGRNMSAVAKSLQITVGSLSTSVSGLVEKGYVQRRRSEEDRRIVYVSLTEQGERAYRDRENHHRKMTMSIIKELDRDEQHVLVKTLDTLSNFFRDDRQAEGAGSDD